MKGSLLIDLLDHMGWGTSDTGKNKSLFLECVYVCVKVYVTTCNGHPDHLVTQVRIGL